MFAQIKNPVGDMEEGDELTFPNDIAFEGDRSVMLAGDTAASRPTLSGGGTGRFFQVYYGAVLELRYLGLADGFAHDSGDWWGEEDEEDHNRGGAIIVRKATLLLLLDCILRSCYAGDYVRCLRTRGGGVVLWQPRVQSSLIRLVCPCLLWPGSRFDDRMASQGGALYLWFGIITIMQTKFVDNQAVRKQPSFLLPCPSTTSHCYRPPRMCELS